jgi:copper chaperone
MIMMEKSVLKVEGMSCDHCVKAVTKAVTALPGIGGVTVDLKTGTVTVEADLSQSPLDKIKSEIEGQGYDIVG